jgi:hypothetical protein
MASTRSKNTPGDYELEQRTFQLGHNYLSYEHSPYYAVQQHTYLPGQGLIGMKASNQVLAGNGCDIESQLFGIGSTNLVNPVLPVSPQIYTLRSLDIANKVPLVMPDSFKPLENQRPLFLN